MSRLIAPNFTPGPWVTMNTTDVFTGLGAKTASGTSAAYNDGWHIADCNAGGSYDGLGNLVDIPLDELRANAKLIAATPMLAEALNSALDPYTTFPCALAGTYCRYCMSAKHEPHKPSCFHLKKEAALLSAGYTEAK